MSRRTRHVGAGVPLNRLPCFTSAAKDATEQANDVGAVVADAPCWNCDGHGIDPDTLGTCRVCDGATGESHEG